MKIFPAIDLLAGRAVRLLRGDYDNATVYSDTPERVAMDFYARGARCLHVVDLDGARDGAPANNEAIARIRDAFPGFVQLGGGIRDCARAERALAMGIDRVIVGTAALESPETLADMLSRFGDTRVAVGVDARDGRVAVRGWRALSDKTSFAFCESLCALGARTIIYTDISRDGALAGANLPAYEALCALTGLSVIASGGVTRQKEARALARMGCEGAIVGKALYEGAVTLEEMLRAAREATA